jgi:thymidylate synthase
MKVNFPSRDNEKIISAWSPKDLNQMALPPCHTFSHFILEKGENLSVVLYQRSADVGFGVPFNIASYALFLRIVAHLTNLSPSMFYHIIGDCHIYTDHIEVLKEQIKRIPKPFPILEINKEKTKVEDFKFEDFILIDYASFPKLKMKMAA